MRVTGDRLLAAPADAVRALLADPAVLAGSVPGCERLRATGGGVFLLTVGLTDPLVAGVYRGQIAVSSGPDAQSRTLTGALTGDRGTIGGRLTVRLTAAENSTSLLEYEAEVTADGPVAGVGDGLLTDLVQRLAGETLSALDDIVVGARPPAAAGQVASGTPVAGRPEGSQTEPDQVPRPTPRLNAVRERLRTGASRGTWAGVRAGLLAGGAVGLAGILIGAAIGRRRTARDVKPGPVASSIQALGSGRLANLARPANPRRPAKARWFARAQRFAGAQRFADSRRTGRGRRATRKGEGRVLGARRPQRRA